MRKTLHDYVIWLIEYESPVIASSQILESIDDYANLTNRKPKLGDFVACDDEGNFLEKPDYFENEHYNDLHINEQKKWIEYQQALDRVIFKGDWEVQKHKSALGEFIKIENKDGIILEFLANEEVYFNHKIANRIEDLPRQIEFKEEVI